MLAGDYRCWWETTGVGGRLQVLVGDYRCWWETTGVGGRLQVLVGDYWCWRETTGVGGRLQMLVGDYRCWWETTGVGGRLQMLVGDYRCWWETTGVGGRLQVLAGDYRCWRETTGVGGRLLVLVVWHIYMEVDLGKFGIGRFLRLVCLWCCIITDTNKYSRNKNRNRKLKEDIFFKIWVMYKYICFTWMEGVDPPFWDSMCHESSLNTETGMISNFRFSYWEHSNVEG